MLWSHLVAAHCPAMVVFLAGEGRRRSQNVPLHRPLIASSASLLLEHNIVRRLISLTDGPLPVQPMKRSQRGILDNFAFLVPLLSHVRTVSDLFVLMQSLKRNGGAIVRTFSTGEPELGPFGER